MKLETSLVATRGRFQQGAADIQRCQGRPNEMSTEEWYLQQGITKVNFYYRLRRVCRACLNHMGHDIVPVSQKILIPATSNPDTGASSELRLSVGDTNIYIDTDTPLIHL